MLRQNLISKHPLIAQLAKMHWFAASVTYSHHRVALFGNKASQEKLASRISTVLDITLNDNDGLPNLMSKVQAGVESLEIAMMDLMDMVSGSRIKKL